MKNYYYKENMYSHIFEHSINLEQISRRSFKNCINLSDYAMILITWRSGSNGLTRDDILCLVKSWVIVPKMVEDDLARYFRRWSRSIRNDTVPIVDISELFGLPIFERKDLCSIRQRV